jgi:hypothetical protein
MTLEMTPFGLRLVSTGKSWYKNSMHEADYKDFECPKLGKKVILKFAHIDHKADFKTPFTVEGCDGAIECGVAKYEYITISYNWSMCPYRMGRIGT